MSNFNYLKKNLRKFSRRPPAGLRKGLPKGYVAEVSADWQALENKFFEATKKIQMSKPKQPKKPVPENPQQVAAKKRREEKRAELNAKLEALNKSLNEVEKEVKSLSGRAKQFHSHFSPENPKAILKVASDGAAANYFLQRALRSKRTLKRKVIKLEKLLSRVEEGPLHSNTGSRVTFTEPEMDFPEEDFIDAEPM